MLFAYILLFMILFCILCYYNLMKCIFVIRIAYCNIYRGDKG